MDYQKMFRMLAQHGRKMRDSGDVHGRVIRRIKATTTFQAWQAMRRAEAIVLVNYRTVFQK